MFILVDLVLAVLPVDKLSRRFRSPKVQREWKDWKVTASVATCKIERGKSKFPCDYI
jgi:hypothetical protein